MARLRPYTNWTPERLKKELLNQVDSLNAPHLLEKKWKAVIEQAFSDPKWDVIRDYNGCTIVQDHFHPCPACFVHDYMWLTGRGGKKSDYIFRRLMEFEGMKKLKRNFRWFGVRVGWFFWFMWKRRGQELTFQMYDLHDYLKSI